MRADIDKKYAYLPPLRACRRLYNVQRKVVLLLHLHMGGFKKDSAMSLKYYTLSKRERVINCTMMIMVVEHINNNEKYY